MVMKTRMLPGRRALGPMAPSAAPTPFMPQQPGKPPVMQGYQPPGKEMTMPGMQQPLGVASMAGNAIRAAQPQGAGPVPFGGAPQPQAQFNPFQRPKTFVDSLNFANHRKEARGALSGDMGAAPQWLQQAAQQYGNSPNMGGFVPQFVRRAAFRWGLAPRPQPQDMNAIGSPWSTRW